MLIPDPDVDFLPISDPVVTKTPDPQHSKKICCHNFFVATNLED